MLADYAEPDDLSNRLLEAEKRNLKAYGFGIKGFTLSMIETAIEVTEGRVPSTVIHQIVDAGRDLLNHPIEPCRMRAPPSNSSAATTVSS